jgi:hypothetical protein
MAGEDRATFAAIRTQFGLKEQEVNVVHKS